MPGLPYLLTGIVKDVGNVAYTAGGTARVIDVTLGLMKDFTLAADGSFTADLALIGSYAHGDALQVVIYNAAKTKSTEFRHTVDAGLPGSDAGTLYLHWTKPILGDSILAAAVLSNKDDSAEFTVDLYDRKYDQKLLSMDIGPNSSFSPYLGMKGVEFKEGICIIRESDADAKVEVQLVVR
jgi:hypothetical protein